MTQEEKAKAYDEALERAREYNKSNMLINPMNVIPIIFPELRESEDERIRTAIMKMVSHICGGYPFEKYGIFKKDALDWLEKQKEDKEELVYRLNGLMQEYIKEGKDDEEKEHRLKCYKLFWDALEDTSYFEQKEQKPAECADDVVEEAEEYTSKVDCGEYEIAVTEAYIAGVLSERNRKPAEWSEEDEKMYNSALWHIKNSCGNGGKNSGEFDVYNWLKNRVKSLRPSWKPSEEKKKETFDGADIGYGLETAIDILENGFTHYQTDDGEYERKQALDVLIFLLNEARKKEDAKLWSKDIVESIVTWATEKLQLYSMKESNPYVETVKNNAQKVLDWAKEQWPIYFGWEPSEEQMIALDGCLEHWSGNKYQKEILESLKEQLEKLI